MDTLREERRKKGRRWNLLCKRKKKECKKQKLWENGGEENVIDFEVNQKKKMGGMDTEKCREEKRRTVRGGLSVRKKK